MRRRDLLTIVESVYELEGRSEAVWLRAIANDVSAVFGGRFGVYALTYDASDLARTRFSKPVFVGVDDARVRELVAVDCADVYRRSPELVDAVFRRLGYGPSRKLPGQDELVELHRKLVANGVHEILGVNGVNVDGRGAHVGILVDRPSSSLGADTLARLSSHLAAGFRLRKRLDGESAIDRAEAILEPSGKVTHALREAKVHAARRRLADAVVALDRLRGPLRRRDPRRALAAWHALVDGRWSLVDHFERDGRRFVLAERNDPDVAPFELLTDRERQVVALAALGQGNKMIAYELGIATSTVGVLLARASRKVGATTRRQLVTAYRARRSEG